MQSEGGQAHRSVARLPSRQKTADHEAPQQDLEDASAAMSVLLAARSALQRAGIPKTALEQAPGLPSVADKARVQLSELIAALQPSVRASCRPQYRGHAPVLGTPVTMWRALLQVNEMAFVAVADMPTLGVAGLDGVRLLAECKTAFTTAVVMPFVTRSTRQRQSGNRGGRADADKAAEAAAEGR